MESLPEQLGMLKFNPATFKMVRQEYSFDKVERVKEAVDLFEDWIKKQSHFTQTEFDRAYLERIIIGSKGSVERAKERLDKMCTMRTLMPSFFNEEIDARKDFDYVKDTIIHLVLPTITKDHERVFFAKTLSSNFTTQLVHDGYRVACLFVEYIRRYDYSLSNHLVFDFRGLDVLHAITFINISEAREVYHLFIEAYGVRIKGIHILTESKWTEVMVNLARQVASKKVLDRIQVHKTLESLHEKVQSDVLPVEYGGKEKPLMELREDWLNELSSEDFKEYWRRMCKAKTDETFRQSDHFNTQYMGMPGTFRTLSVD